MLVNAIETLNFGQNYNNQIKQTAKPIYKEQISKPAEQQSNAGMALRAYFLGAQSLSFKGIHCSTGDFAVKQLDDVPCCCCGDRMIRGQEMPNVVHSFADLQGKELADKIEKDKDYFRASQRVAATLIADEARKDDSLDVLGAFEKAKNNLPQKVTNYCVNVLNTLTEQATQIYGNENNPVSKLTAQEIKNVQNGKIARIPFTEKLETLKNGLSEENYEQILDTAMNLPEGMKSVTKIFSKQKGNDTSYSIMNKLLTGALHTAEHVHPKSLGGPNSTSNYLGECALCNNPRGNMSYAQWLKVHPEYPIKVQEHIEYVEQKIVDGEIPADYDSYPVEINQTLTKESNGVMTLKVLTPEKIKELREQKLAGKEVNVSEITKELFENEENIEKKAA